MGTSAKWNLYIEHYHKNTYSHFVVDFFNFPIRITLEMQKNKQ